MRKTLLALSFAVAVFVAAAYAQSGRRPVAPPQATPEVSPTPEPATPEREAANSGRTFEASSTLPESLMKRELQSIEKGSFRLADFEGKVLVVNLWASWCGPCRREIPDFEEVRGDYAGRGVEFVGLTTENPRTDGERVKQFLHDVKFGFRLGWADRETAIGLMSGRNSIPQTYVIGRDGRVILHMRGYGAARGTAMLREAIDRGLGATTDAAR